MPRSSRTKLDTVRQHHNAPRCQSTIELFPTYATGGTTGGEETATSDMLFIAHRRAGLWGQYTEPEVFWLYWETVEAVDQAQRRLANAWQSERDQVEEIWAEGNFIDLTSKTSEEIAGWHATETGDGRTSSPQLARAELSSRSKDGTGK